MNRKQRRSRKKVDTKNITRKMFIESIEKRNEIIIDDSYYDEKTKPIKEHLKKELELVANKELFHKMNKDSLMRLNTVFGYGAFYLQKGQYNEQT